ncbi:MAG: NUDIX hydrolase [Anaerolineales bacterium]|nr:NUDIX hydrolase [Anaerolineales bacterium]
MSPEIIAAIVGGVFAVIATLIPLFVKKYQEKQQRTKPDNYPLADGLSAVVGIVQKGNEVLLVQRRERILNLSWQFPAGVVKPGKDIRDKVESEVLQETGIKCKAQSYLGARVPETNVLCHYVHCLYLDGEEKNLDPAENSQVAWVYAGDVGQLVTSDIYTEVQKLLDKVKKDSNTGKVVLGVVVHSDKVLLIKKRVSDNGLNWQFPGGFVENRETEKKAVEREVFEETGIRCEPIRKIGERSHPKTQSLIAYWLCNFKMGEIEITETEKISDIAWMDLSGAIGCLGDSLFNPVKEVLENT